jgi:hypothetical protein
MNALSPPVDATCLSCGYALRENVSGRCPECGRAFDDEDVMSTDTKARRDIILRTRGFQHLPLACWLWTMTCWVVFVRCNMPENWYRQFDLLVPGILVATYFRSWLNAKLQIASFRNCRERSLRRAGWIACAVILIWTCCFEVNTSGDPCDHGWIAGTHVVGIAWSANGGPCKLTPLGWTHHVSGNWYVWWNGAYF